MGEERRASEGQREKAIEERRQVMAVYKPTRKGEASKFYFCEFVYQGKRFQESTGATSKTVAKEYEKRRKAELERAAAGLPTEQKAARIRTVNDVVASYLEGYKLTHRSKSVLFAEGRLKQVKKSLGNVVLSDLTDDCIREYVRQRQAANKSGRTINMEVGELSRAIGRTWLELWPRVKKLEERKDVGRALSPAEQRVLLDGLKDRRTPHLATLVPVLLLTGMRAGEALSLRWSRVDLMGLAITVGRAKTANGTGRMIPINDDLASILAAHRAWFVERFGEPSSPW